MRTSNAASIACALAGLWLSRAHSADFLPPDRPVQSQMVRTMVMTCRLEETIRFWRDVMGQRVIADERAPPSMVPFIWNGPPDTKIRMVVMSGSGEYPAGNIMGSRIGFLGIENQDSPGCRTPVNVGKGEQGTIIMPTRVDNIAEIERRARAMGMRIVKPLGPSPTRLTRQMIVADPNGVLLELFELNYVPIEDK